MKTGFCWQLSTLQYLGFKATITLFLYFSKCRKGTTALRLMQLT